jgi:hypothetical protein
MSFTNSPKPFSPSASKDPVLRLATAKAKARAEQSENFEYGLKTFTDRSTLAYYFGRIHVLKVKTHCHCIYVLHELTKNFFSLNE